MLQARILLKKGGQEVPIEVLNNLGVLHFERGEFEVCAVATFKKNFRIGCGIKLNFKKNLSITFHRSKFVLSSLCCGSELTFCQSLSLFFPGGLLNYVANPVK